MKKKLMALLMAMVLVLGMSTTALAADSSVGDNTPPGKVELTWSETSPWTLKVENKYEGAKLYGYVEIYKDGEEVDWDGFEVTDDSDILVDVSWGPMYWGDGKYSIKVEVYDYETEVLKYTGAIERTYTAPAAQLATPADLVYDYETEVISFKPVEGASEYLVRLVEYYAGREVGGITLISLGDEDIKDGKVQFELTDFSSEYDWYKEQYTNEDFRAELVVRALSANVEKARSSEYARFVFFENKLTTEQVKDKFDEAFENVEENKEEAANVLVGVSNDTITEMLKTDTEFAAKVEKLDELLAEDLGDGLKGASSTTEAIDASKVKVVGMAINAASLNATTVELKIKDVAVEEKVAVPSGYATGVQLDISFIADDRTIEDLVVPMSITTEIPAGVDTKDLVILHYHGDATEPTVIVPTVNADGTMTFIVDGFSTFVVTNQVAETGADGGATTSPVTGDTSTTAIICSLLLLAAGVVLMKRNAFAK